MSREQTEAKAEVIKLGIDIHQRQYVVVQQVEGEAPKAPQKFTPEAFLRQAAKLKQRANRVVSCYEAGCFGYVLHRQLESMGIENVTHQIKAEHFCRFVIIGFCVESRFVESKVGLSGHN